jgi:hypothetical protein
MPELAALDGISRQLALGFSTLYSFASEICDHNSIAADYSDVTLFEEHEAARNRQQCGDIRRYKVLTNAKSNNYRTALAREDQFARLVTTHDDQRISTVELGYGFADSGFQIRRVLAVMMDKVRDDFGIRVTVKNIASSRQLVTQYVVVLNDAVMDDCDAGTGNMRVGIALARGTVCSPAGMRDPQVTLDRRCIQRRLQFDNFAQRAAPMNVARIMNGKTG